MNPRTPALSVERLNEIKALAEGVTTDDWRFARTPIRGNPDYIAECSYLGDTLICLSHDYEDYMADCKFIEAASPQTVLSLVEMAEGKPAEPSDEDWPKDLSRMLTERSAPFYITQEDVAMAHPESEASGMLAADAYEAAVVLVGERHAKRDLVALVCALLQRAALKSRSPR